VVRPSHPRRQAGARFFLVTINHVRFQSHRIKDWKAEAEGMAKQLEELKRQLVREETERRIENETIAERMVEWRAEMKEARETMERKMEDMKSEAGRESGKTEQKIKELKKKVKKMKGHK